MDLVFGVNNATFPRNWFFAAHKHQGIEIVGILHGHVTLTVDDETLKARF